MDKTNLWGAWRKGAMVAGIPLMIVLALFIWQTTELAMACAK